MRKIEWKLISELMKNSRRSDRDLAKVIGKSQPTVTRTRTRLEKQGYIKEYTMLPDFQKLGFEIHQSHAQRWFGKKLIVSLPPNKNIAIDGLRYPEDHALMVESFGPSFFHIHIEAPFEIRQKRIKERKIEDIPIQESMKNPTESMINYLSKLANHTICNDNDKELAQLHEQIDRLL